MENPPNLNYCKIVGSFKAFVADNQDADDLPDFVPMTGIGLIWPNVTTAKNTQVGYKATYFNSQIPVTVDVDGDLSQGGRKYVMVLAQSDSINPNNFNYSISLSLSAQGETTTRKYGPYSFNVVPGGTIDIADVIPVSAYGGNPIVQGPQGDIGPIGPVGPPLNATVLGTVTGPETPGTAGPTGAKGDKGDPGGITLGTLLAVGTDWNTVTADGYYRILGGNGANKPALGGGTAFGVIRVSSADTGGSRLLQTFEPVTGGTAGLFFYQRSYIAGTGWTTWKTFNSTRVDQTVGRVIYQWDDLNQREQLIYGDTGQRNVSLDQQWIDCLTNSASSVILNPSNVVRIQRIGYQCIVHWAFDKNATGAIYPAVAFPVGWRPAHPVHTLATNSGMATARIYHSGGANTLGYNSTVVVPAGSATLIYSTVDPWPTSLPGSAVGSIPNV